MSTTMQPVAPTQRIKEIDFVRGLALLGILFVNMGIFRTSMFGTVFDASSSDGLATKIAHGFIYMFAEGKFYSLFSLLFGFGFSIFLLKERELGMLMEPAFKRRMLGLLGFGFIHAFFIWSGDILITYSILGFFLIAFKSVSPKGMIKWCIGFLLFIIGLNALIFAMVELASQLPNADAVITQIESSQKILRERADVAQQVYSSTNYLAMIGIRLKELGLQYSSFFVVFPSVLSMFLIGLALGKSGKLSNIEQNKSFFKKLFWITLIIGLPIAALHPYGMFKYSRFAYDYNGLYHIVGFFLGSPLLALAYFSGGLLLFNKYSQVKSFQMVSYAGRMALTNYLIQSIICTLIFYGYGLGLVGRVNVIVGLFITVAIWLIQLPFSKWWLTHFKFGPAEWIWRWITYKERISNRL